MSKARELAELGAAYDSGALSNRNLIINGAMNLDQRNSGSATTNGSSGYTTVDRWKAYDNLSAGASTAQQVTDVPDNQGFKNSLKFTVTTADSDLGTGEVLFIQQSIEGNNFSVLRYGTSSAKTSTISFWVKSSETGSFGGSLQRSVNYDRQYGFTYTISAANTWEYKTVTIPGDTGGTWPTDNTAGASLMFNLGSGSSRLISTANQWGTTSLGFQVSGTKNIAGTVNATFFVTGVQMEVGTEATPFEHRSFGDELRRCQRYYEVLNQNSRNSAGGDGFNNVATGASNGSNVYGNLSFKVTKRGRPAVAAEGSAKFRAFGDGTYANLVAGEFYSPAVETVRIRVDTNGFSAGQAGAIEFDGANSTNGFISIDAEL